MSDKRPTALYSLSLSGKPAQTPFSPPDFGETNLDELPSDFSHIKKLMAKYGSDVYVAMCLKDKAQEYGYMPKEQASEEFKRAVLPEILIAEFSQDTKFANELTQRICQKHGLDDKAVRDQIEREKLEMKGQGMAQAMTQSPKQGR